MNSVEILERKAALKEEAQGIIATAQKEIRKLSDGESERFNAIKAEIETLNEQLRSLDVALPNENKNINIHQKSNKMEKRFSLLSAIKNVAENRAQDEVTRAVIDSGARESRAASINYVGQIQIPTSEEFRTVTVATEGNDVVATDVMDVLTPLRAKNVLLQSGVKFLSGLKGDVQYPAMDAFSATWEGETATTAATTPTFSSVKLQPKRLSVVVPISKQFLIQDSASAEAALRSEVVNAINGKLESTILGTANATATQPLGLFYSASALGTVADFSDITEMEGDLEAANMGEFRYIVSPKAKAALRSMVKASGIGMVWENNAIDGVNALTTSHIANNGIIVGDFSQMVLAQFGATDITVDNVTLAADGCIRLVVNSYWDFKPLRSGCYVVRNVSVE